MNILDMESKEWEFSFRYWPNCGSKTYVLEGLRDFMFSRKLQAGDTGNFSYYAFMQINSNQLSLICLL